MKNYLKKLTTAKINDNPPRAYDEISTKGHYALTALYTLAISISAAVITFCAIVIDREEHIDNLSYDMTKKSLLPAMGFTFFVSSLLLGCKAHNKYKLNKMRKPEESSQYQTSSSSSGGREESLLTNIENEISTTKVVTCNENLNKFDMKRRKAERSLQLKELPSRRLNNTGEAGVSYIRYPDIDDIDDIDLDLSNKSSKSQNIGDAKDSSFSLFHGIDRANSMSSTDSDNSRVTVIELIGASTDNINITSIDVNTESKKESELDEKGLSR